MDLNSVVIRRLEVDVSDDIDRAELGALTQRLSRLFVAISASANRWKLIPSPRTLAKSN